MHIMESSRSYLTYCRYIFRFIFKVLSQNLVKHTVVSSHALLTSRSKCIIISPVKEQSLAKRVT